MQNTITIIIGAPHSGLTLLNQSFQFFGIAPLDADKSIKPVSINDLLFQDLDISPFATTMPPNWLHTSAAYRAKKRIRKLLASSQQDIDNDNQSPVNSDPLWRKIRTSQASSPLEPDKGYQIMTHNHTLSLWLEVLAEQGIEVRIIHIIRHPYEIALSLKHNQGIDLLDGHIIWLSHIRSAQQAFKNTRNIHPHDAVLDSDSSLTVYRTKQAMKQSSSQFANNNYQLTDKRLITLDQLLADPVSTLRSCLSSVSQFTINRALLDFVQPNLKKKHVSSISESDRENFKPFVKVYDQLRAGQHSLSGQMSGNKRIKILSSPESDLIDSLLQAAGQSSSRCAYNYSNASEARGHQKTPLYAHVIFPTTNPHGEAIETILLTTSGWQEIRAYIPDSNAIQHKPIQIVPLNTKGLVKISGVCLVDKSTKTKVWEATTVMDLEGLILKRSLVKLSVPDNLTMLSTGDDPLIELFIKTPLTDRPYELVLWLQGTSELDALMSCPPPQLLADKDYRIGTIHHLSSSGGTLMSRCLAAMPDVVMLSEIHPYSNMQPWILFDPTGPLQQFRSQYPDIFDSDQTTQKQIFSEQIYRIIQKCKENKKFLILRDHAHTDFLYNDIVNKPQLYTHLNEFFKIKPIVTIRHPVDAYLSMTTNFPLTNYNNVTSFEIYCERFLKFLKAYEQSNIFLYEDFVDNPDEILREMCSVYGINYSPSYKDEFYKITLTGDSGRGRQQKFKEIKNLDRREFSQNFYQEVKNSLSFKKICELLGYEDDIQPPDQGKAG